MKKAVIYLILSFIAITSFRCSGEQDYFPAFSTSSAPEPDFNELWDQFYVQLDKNNMDSALFQAESIKALSTQFNNKKWLAKSNKAIGYIYGLQGQIKESTSYYLTAADLFSETGDLKNLAGIYINLGTSFLDNHDYVSAISFYTKASDIFHYEGSYTDKALAFRGIALCHEKQKEYKQAEKYLALSKKAAESGKDYYNLGLTYNSWGNLKLEQQEYTKAHEYFLLTLGYADSLGEDSNLRAIASHNLGETLFLKGEHEQAKKWISKAISEKNKLGNPILAQSSYVLFAKLLIKENKQNEAVAILEEGINKVGPTTVHNAVNESLMLINETLLEANKQASPAEYPEFNKKLLTYSQKLLAYNENLAETKGRLETIIQQQAIDEAMEKHAFNEQIAQIEERNTYLQYAIMIPVFFLICAVISVYLTMRRNMKYKMLYGKIEAALNSKKLRHLNKK